MNEETDPQDEVRTAALLGDLMLMRDSRCCDCKAPICGHEALMSLTMGFKDAPRCWSCLAVVLELGKEQLRDRLFAHIEHRPCHHTGWLWASRKEGFEPEELPGCLWPSPSAARGAPHRDLPRAACAEGPGRSPDLTWDAEWGAGDMACGELVLQLRIRLASMQPGQVLKVTAEDPGAPEDLPAWCRLTGHGLVVSNHPAYLIRRKEK